MTIYLGTDHAGFALKEELVVFLRQDGFAVEDMGAHTLDPTDDYPALVRPAAEAVAADRTQARESFGIILGGSGQGEAIVANRVAGARAAVYYGGNTEIVRLARIHNDANILALGARFLTTQEAIDAVRLFLATPFSGEERHKRRIAFID